MFEGSNILLTGGTGSFGRAFVQHLLDNHNPSRVVVFSRDEMKQWQMAQTFAEEDRLRFFIGDVRDRERLYRALDGVDFVVHAAATKIVPTAEYNPFEAIKTNVLGAMNLIDAALDSGVKKVVALSTDKASSPINLYGATKLVSDKLFSSAMNYAAQSGCVFSVVRYGNVMGSRGSVIPFFIQQKARGERLTITDPRMTRFMITLEQGVALVEQALLQGRGGEIFVKKIPSMTVLQIADAIDPGGERKIVGIRPGEKLHEQMIGADDAPNTREFDDFYIIQNPALDLPNRWENVGQQVPAGFSYSSDSNPNWMSEEDLLAWIREKSTSMLEI